MAPLLQQGLQTLQWVAIGYFALFLLFVLIADFAIFHPPKPTNFKESDSTHNIKVGNKTIKATYLPAPNSEYVLLYSHGNAEDLGMMHPIFEYYQQRGYAIFAYDYQGYGLSEGKVSEHNTYQDIYAAYRYMIDTLKIDPNRIIVYGRSLGGGPTLELAKNHDVGAVILESTFTTAFRVITHYPIFPYDKFRNIKKISKINAPVLVIHGDDDTIISIYHGKRLYKKALQPKMSFWVQEADHNDLLQVAGESYWQALDIFIDSIKTQKPETPKQPKTGTLAR